MFAVPDSSNSAALGYAEVSGIPFELGLIRNHYVGRTFIQPGQEVRDFRVKVKYNPCRERYPGQARVVVDYSIVRGTTSKALVGLVREAGAGRGVTCGSPLPRCATPVTTSFDIPSRTS